MIVGVLMFELIEDLVEVLAISIEKPGQRLILSRGDTAITTGQKVAVNGMAQTVIDVGPKSLTFFVHEIDLQQSSLARLKIGDAVVLQGFSGFTVTGERYFARRQVDGLARWLTGSCTAALATLQVELPWELLRYCRSGQGIYLDGFLLVIDQIFNNQLTCSLPAGNWRRSTFPNRLAGEMLNVEVDQLPDRRQQNIADRGPHADRHTFAELSVDLPTELGAFTLQLLHYPRQPEVDHLLLSHNLTSDDDRVPLIRIHSECITGETFRSQRCDCNWQLQQAMVQIQQEGCGAIIYLRQEGRGIGLRAKLLAYKLQQTQHLDTVEANLRLGFADDVRDYQVAVEALQSLGLKKIRLLTNNPRKIAALTMAGLIVERVALEAPSDYHNHNYLLTKKKKSGHLLANLPN